MLFTVCVLKNKHIRTHTWIHSQWYHCIYYKYQQERRKWTAENMKEGRSFTQSPWAKQQLYKRSGDYLSYTYVCFLVFNCLFDCFSKGSPATDMKIYPLRAFQRIISSQSSNLYTFDNYGSLQWSIVLCGILPWHFSCRVFCFMHISVMCTCIPSGWMEQGLKQTCFNNDSGLTWHSTTSGRPSGPRHVQVPCG